MSRLSHTARKTKELAAIVQSFHTRKPAYQRPAGYEIHSVEPFIYDKSGPYHISRVTLPQIGLIPVDKEEKPSRCVLRCFFDWQVLVLDIVMLLSVLGTSMVSPLSFIWGGTWSDPTAIPGGRQLLQTDLVFDYIYAGHLLLRLRITYMMTDRRVEVVNSSRILKHHICNPLYWALWLTVSTHLWTYWFGVSLMCSTWKIIRVHEVLFLPHSLWRIQDTRWIRLGRPVVLLVLGAHWVACLLSHIGGFREAALAGDGVSAYATSIEGATVDGWVSLYFMAFVESIYMLTGALDNPLGDGSIREKQFGSLAIVAVFGPIGCVVVSFFISSIVREQALQNALDIRHQENKAFMTRALQNLNIPQDLQSRVFSLHEFQKMCHDREAFNALFNKNNLSPPLDLALRVYLYHESVLLNSPYLRHKDANYILEIISGFEDKVYLPGDYVTRRGQVGSAIFFVIRGELSVLVPSERNGEKRSLEKTQVVSKKHRGDYFGEIALLKDCVRTAWVRADTYVLVSTLERAHAEAIWRHYPDEQRHLAEMVVETAKADRERAASLPDNGATERIRASSNLSEATQFTAQTPARTSLTPASEALVEVAEGNIATVSPTNRRRPDQDDQQDNQLAQLTVLLERHIIENRRTLANQQEQLSMLQHQQAALDSKVDAMLNSMPTTIGVPSSSCAPRSGLRSNFKFPFSQGLLGSSRKEVVKLADME